ncbi:MAG: B12-binding domain-containing radical SAM protein [Spirochaetia bacterium]
MEKPKALLIIPPVYDFALYDHYLKPYGILRIAAWLKGTYDIRVVNCLDYRDPETGRVIPGTVRKQDGTGKFPREPIPLPRVISESGKDPGRNFARYGLSREVFRRELLRAGEGRNPDIIFLATGMTYWYLGVKEAAEEAESAFPGVPVVCGGIYASLLPEHCGKITGGITGAAGTASELGRILEKQDLPVPPGFVTDWPLIHPVFRDAGVVRMNKGCPYRCGYCASGKLDPGFSQGDPDKVFRFLRQIRETYGTRNFAFYDDALLVKKEKSFLPLLEQLKGDDFFRDVSFYLPNALHIALLDLDTARAMKHAGFREIRLGFESGSPDFHVRHDNKYAPEEFGRAVALLREAGFRQVNIRVYILAGLPGQRWEEVEESVRYAGSHGVSLSLAEYSPVPGSAMWDESVRLSNFPLEKEPLFQNNTFFPLEWSGFTRERLEYLKELIRQIHRGRSR